jgi:hypothetical protein
MARRRPTDTISASEVDEATDSIQETTAPVMVRITNKESRPKEVLLSDGTTVRLAPWSPRGTGHTSKPIPVQHLAYQRKDGRPGPLHKAVGRGHITIEEVS